MTTSSEYIARFNLSGPEEFCNTIANHDSGMRIALQFLRAAIEQARDLRISPDAYANWQHVGFLLNHIAGLEKQALQLLTNIESHGWASADPELEYPFLLDGVHASSPYAVYLRQIGVLTTEVTESIQALIQILERYQPNLGRSLEVSYL